MSKGFIRARFGEIEQRGAALTPAGRELYDRLLSEVRGEMLPAADGSNADAYMQKLADGFSAFPSTNSKLRRQGLAYFQYFVSNTEKLAAAKREGLEPPAAGSFESDQSSSRLEALIDAGVVDFQPLVYEDFLPVSAAGIFASNASDKTRLDEFSRSSRQEFEAALGQPVVSEFEMYADMEQQSIRAVLELSQA